MTVWTFPQAEAIKDDLELASCWMEKNFPNIKYWITIITISVLSFCPRTISKDLGPWPRSPQPCRRGWHFFIIGKSLSYWKTPIPNGHSLEKLLDDSRRCNSSGEIRLWVGGGMPSWAYLQSCSQWNAVTIDALYCKGSSSVIAPWFTGTRMIPVLGKFQQAEERTSATLNSRLKPLLALTWLLKHGSWRVQCTLWDNMNVLSEVMACTIDSSVLLCGCF